MRELLAHIDFIQLFDGMPIEMHPPRHVLDRHRTAQSTDLHGKSQGVIWVVRQEVEFFVLHAACFAFHAVHVKIEINVSVSASKIARAPPAFIVKAATNFLAPTANRFFERRSSVTTKAGCLSSS